MKKELGKREMYYPYDRLSGAKLRGARFHPRSKLEFIIHSQCQAYSHDFNEPSFVKIGSVVLEISQVEYFVVIKTIWRIASKSRIFGG